MTGSRNTELAHENGTMKFTEAIESQYKSALIRSEAVGERAFRENAWAQYTRLGLPDRKTESWKYTSLTAVTRAEWPLASESIQIPTEALELVARWKNEYDILILVNGEPRGMPPSGISVLNFSAAHRVEFEDGWIGMSAALARPGFELRVGRDVTLAKPLLIVHSYSGERGLSPSLHRISLEPGARAEIAEVFLGGSSAEVSGTYFRSEITLAELGAGAELSWMRIQQEGAEAHHFSDIQCQLSEDAKLYSVQINGGAIWSRSSMRAEITGERAEAYINGITFARGAQHSDQRVEVRHLAGNTISQQLFKGVLKDRSRGVLNGKIYIAKGAQKVASSQLNHNLLLTPLAEANTKPELEIYADDVKANHGASIGRMDEERMFYLMSRGITRAAAQHMLARAFVNDVLMKMPSSILFNLGEEAVESILPHFSVELEAGV